MGKLTSELCIELELSRKEATSKALEVRRLASKGVLLAIAEN